MIQDSFQNSLDKEVDRSMLENQMFQNSYELTRNGLSEEQQEQISIPRLVKSFYRMHDETNENVRIYDAEGKVLYQDNDLKLTTSIKEHLNDENNVGYEIVQSGNEIYIVVTAYSSFGDLIETTQNITEIFREREAMYVRYKAGVVLMTVLVGGIILLVLFLVMRNVQKLSKATRQYARGDYNAGVEIHSRDEIGMLAEDFNWMINVMNTQMKKLQNEVQRQEEFTAAFAHELKTPLTSIIGYADTIRQVELSKEENDMCADYIYSQGKRLQSLAYKLLEMTMVEQQEITFSEIRVQKLLDDVESTVKTALRQKQLTLKIKVQDGVIEGDRDLLSSLFINLIDNARKASTVGKTIFVTGVNLPDRYAVSVEDEGSGISPEEITRITEAFYMVDKSRARKEGGVGLGLTLCEKIVHLHQGNWKFESEPGKGLKVTVYFRKSERQKGIYRTVKMKTGN